MVWLGAAVSANGTEVLNSLDVWVLAVLYPIFLGWICGAVLPRLPRMVHAVGIPLAGILMFEVGMADREDWSFLFKVWFVLQLGVWVNWFFLELLVPRWTYWARTGLTILVSILATTGFLWWSLSLSEPDPITLIIQDAHVALVAWILLFSLVFPPRSLWFQPTPAPAPRAAESALP